MFRSFFLWFSIFVMPFSAFGISDLHIAVDSSLSLPFRKIIKEYAQTRSMIITADFKESDSLFADLEKVPHIIIGVTNSTQAGNLKGVVFASDKLYLCLAKSSPLRALVNRRDKLSTVLKIIKKNSALVVPSSRTAVGKIINNLVLELGADRLIEVNNFENLGYTATNSGAFVILPGSVAMQHESAGLEKLLEIPQELYQEILYNITVLENEGINQSREFVQFLFLGEIRFRELGFYKGS